MPDALIAAELASVLELLRPAAQDCLLLSGSAGEARGDGEAPCWSLQVAAPCAASGVWRGSLLSPPVLDQALDVLVLHRLPLGLPWASLLHEWLPCLRPGGRLLVIDALPQPPTRAARLRLLRALAQARRDGLLRLRESRELAMVGGSLVATVLPPAPGLRLHWRQRRASTLWLDLQVGGGSEPVRPVPRARRARVLLAPQHLSGA